MTEAEEIMYAVTATINSTVHCQMILQRWTEVISCMIKKSPENQSLEKLRVIHLFKADLNLMIGIIWERKKMKAHEQIGNIGKQTWHLEA